MAGDHDTDRPPMLRPLRQARTVDEHSRTFSFSEGVSAPASLALGDAAAAAVPSVPLLLPMLLDRAEAPADAVPSAQPSEGSRITSVRLRGGGSADLPEEDGDNGDDDDGETDVDRCSATSRTSSTFALEARDDRDDGPSVSAGVDGGDDRC